MKMFRKSRIKYASKFGKLEHAFGRYMMIPYFTIYLYNKNCLNDKYLTLFSIIGILFWLTYLLSHNLEKRLYGRYGQRG